VILVAAANTLQWHERSDLSPEIHIMNDGDLIRAVQAGDRLALTTLYQRYLGNVWRYASAHLPGRPATVEDLVSETFVAAIQAIKDYDADQKNFCGWLLGIARNKLNDHLRRATREGVVPSATTAAVACDDQDQPAGSVMRNETRDAVVRALDALTDEERLVLEWKYVESFSVREMANHLGRTEKAVEALLYRARNSFRAAYNRQLAQSK
jgi:RNA polymerase sigma-70 factor, ECF subfamily